MRYGMHKLIEPTFLPHGRRLVWRILSSSSGCSAACVVQRSLLRRFHRPRDHVPLCTFRVTSGLPVT